MTPPGSTYPAWYWERLLETLDKAGYAVIKKRDPSMDGRGLNAAAKERYRREKS